MIFANLIRELKKDEIISNISIAYLPEDKALDSLADLLKTKKNLKTIQFTGYTKLPVPIHWDKTPEPQLQKLFHAISENQSIERIGIHDLKGLNKAKIKILANTFKTKKTLQNVELYDASISSLDFESFKELCSGILANPSITKFCLSDYTELPKEYQEWFVSHFSENKSIVELTTNLFRRITFSIENKAKLDAIVKRNQTYVDPVMDQKQAKDAPEKATDKKAEGDKPATDPTLIKRMIALSSVLYAHKGAVAQLEKPKNPKVQQLEYLCRMAEEAAKAARILEAELAATAVRPVNKDA